MGGSLEYNLKVYWMTPLGKALQEAMAEMDIRGELKDQIVEKYERAIEKEFENLNYNLGKNNQGTRFKLQGHCKTYNNIYQVWNFNIEKFSVNLDDKSIRDSSCIFMTIPHGEFQLRRGGVTSRKRHEKFKNKQKKKEGSQR